MSKNNPKEKDFNMFIHYKPGGRKWLLDQPEASYFVDIPGDWDGPFLKLEHGMLTCFFEYSWDGGSGPAIDTANAMGASLIHDALYQLGREGVLPMKYRKKADKIMRKILLEDGVTKARAWWWYVAVRMGARESFKKGTQIS